MSPAPLLLGLALFLASGDDGGMARMETAEAVIDFPAPMAGAAETVADRFPQIRSDLAGVLGWDLTRRPRVVLVGDTETFRRMVGTDLFLAFAVPGKNVMVIDHAKIGGDTAALTATLKHELCHLLLGRRIPRDRLPRWLDEGVAQWVSDGFSELMSDEGARRLNRAVISGDLIPLRRLADRFPAHRSGLILAYEQSKSLVNHVVRDYGAKTVVDILHLLRQGRSLDGALEERLGKDAAALEKEWQSGLSTGGAWIRFLSAHLYGLLFFAAAVITLAAFIRRVRQRRAYGADEEDDLED